MGGGCGESQVRGGARGSKQRRQEPGAICRVLRESYVRLELFMNGWKLSFKFRVE